MRKINTILIILFSILLVFTLQLSYNRSYEGNLHASNFSMTDAGDDDTYVVKTVLQD